MEPNKAKYIKLGIFIVLGLALFVIAIFYIGSKENLFTKTFSIYAIFPTVSGLTQGSSVQLAGINVGTVQSIDIIASDKVKVNMNIEGSIQEFIKKDSEASINSTGLVGNKVLVISAGTPHTPSVEDGDSIHALKPTDIGDIINNLNESSKQAQNIAEDIAEIADKVNRGEGTLGKLVNNSELFDNLDSVMTNIASSSESIDQILTKASIGIDLVTQNIQRLQVSIDTITLNIADITRKLNSSQSLVGTLLIDTVFANNLKGIIKNTNQTTANLELGSFSFYQNMEALKHNFLFKGYFEDLGYWDKADFEKNIQTRETRILNKENELAEREAKLREFQLRLDSLRNKLDSIKIIQDK